MQGWGQTRLAALEGKRKRETFLHGHTTDSAASPFAFTAGARTGGALLQVNFAIDLRCFAHMHG